MLILQWLILLRKRATDKRQNIKNKRKRRIMNKRTSARIPLKLSDLSADSTYYYCNGDTLASSQNGGGHSIQQQHHQQPQQQLPPHHQQPPPEQQQPQQSSAAENTADVASRSPLAATRASSGASAASPTGSACTKPDHATPTDMYLA